MKRQSVESQLGEIEFRKKLVQQQVEGKRIFEDEFDAAGIEKVLDERMKETFDQMILLKEKGVALSPYVEIGAERCQRSLVMENDLGATGAALDISYHMLKSCDYYSTAFSKSKIPLRVCCDANYLPFMSDSIPFVFCYATLHHFPDPAPVIKNVHRILSPGGYFFFCGEPYKRILHLGLRGGASYAELRGASKIRKAFHYFFDNQSRCNEVRHGIVENDDISIRHWKQVLSCFEEIQAGLKSMKYIESRLYNLTMSDSPYLVDPYPLKPDMAVGLVRHILAELTSVGPFAQDVASRSHGPSRTFV